MQKSLGWFEWTVDLSSHFFSACLTNNMKYNCQCLLHTWKSGLILFFWDKGDSRFCPSIKSTRFNVASAGEKEEDINREEEYDGHRKKRREDHWEGKPGDDNEGKVSVLFRTKTTCTTRIQPVLPGLNLYCKGFEVSKGGNASWVMVTVRCGGDVGHLVVMVRVI